MLTVGHNATMKAWKSPIRILLLYLTFLAIWASYNWGGVGVSFWLNQIFHFALLILPGWITYLILVRLKLAQPTRWEHRTISALILFLLFDPLFPWWVFLGVGLLTELIQRLIRVPTGPLTNPAATGVLLISLTGQFATWWGVNFGPRFNIGVGEMTLIMLLTTGVAGYVASKYRKLPIVAVAAAAFSLLYILLLKSSPLPILVDGTLLFFFFVMVVEPKTSPAIPQQQWWYGALVGVLAVLLISGTIPIYWVEPYSAALVVSNLVFNLYRNRKLLLMRLRKKPTVTTQPSIPQPSTPAPVTSASAVS